MAWSPQQEDALKGRQFEELQVYLGTVDSAVVDIGASNVEELLKLMRKFKRSHEDFDYFVMPTTPGRKQQQDTIATIVELAKIGVPGERMRVVFNRVADTASEAVRDDFAGLFHFADTTPGAPKLSPACCLGENEIYQRATEAKMSIPTIANDEINYKALIASATNPEERLALAQKLATRRLAQGVIEEVAACFKALAIG